MGWRCRPTNSSIAITLHYIAITRLVDESVPWLTLDPRLTTPSPIPFPVLFPGPSPGRPCRLTRSPFPCPPPPLPLNSIQTNRLLVQEMPISTVSSSTVSPPPQPPAPTSLIPAPPPLMPACRQHRSRGRSRTRRRSDLDTWTGSSSSLQQHRRSGRAVDLRESRGESGVAPVGG